MSSNNIYMPKENIRGKSKHFILDNFNWIKYKMFKIKANWAVDKKDREELDK